MMNDGKPPINVYHLRVKLKFDKRTYRDILIRGDQTFEILHDIIFRAFDREDEHLYRFTFKKDIPVSKASLAIMRSAGMFPIPQADEIRVSSPECEINSSYKEFNAAKTPIHKMIFQVKQKFEYLFDFGDEWRHEIEVRNIQALNSKEKLPVVIKSNGESPAQYPADDE